MPCVFCKSPEHKLKYCDSLIGENLFSDVNEYHRLNPFNIEGQITFLMAYTQPQLAVICKHQKTRTTGRKDELTFLIIWNQFQSRTTREMVRSLSESNLEDINLAYMYTYAISGVLSRMSSLRRELLMMLENYYSHTYGIVRNGMSRNNYYDMVREYQANPREFNRVNFINRISARSSNQNQKSHRNNWTFVLKLTSHYKFKIVPFVAMKNQMRDWGAHTSIV